MNKLKAYKFKLNPNQEQEILINKTLGCTRLIYNCMLYEKQEKYKNQDKTKSKTEKQYKEKFPFLKEVDSVALQQSRIDLEKSYKNFFNKIKQKQKTSLKYKSKKNPKNSYRTVNSHNCIEVKDNKIKLPKLGYVPFNKSKEILGKIKSVTISKNILNNYYISILCEVDIRHKPINDNQIGIDLGLKDYLTDSNNNKISNPKYLYQLQKKLAKEQKILSKKNKNSNRYQKQRKKVFKIHEKIKNCRNDFLQKLSTKIINENQVIVLEDLNVSGMMKNHCLAKSISDVSWSSFVGMLEYKAEWYGKEIIKIDRFFPSSKMCNNCKSLNKDLQLSDRIWTCENCKVVHDRDLNASKNILEEGIRLKNDRNCRVSSIKNSEVSGCS
jgi:putative transposase